MAPARVHQTALDLETLNVYSASMRMTAEIGSGQLAELVKQVQAGNEVLLTDGNKAVARLLPALDEQVKPAAPFRIRSFSGHKVLTPVITQADIAEDMFSR